MKRRQLLRILAASGLAAPFMGSGSRALAAQGRRPRIVFMFHPSGWQMREVGIREGETLAPIREAGFGDQMSLVEINNRVDREHGTGDAHTGGSATLLTGTISTKRSEGVRVYGSSISLDQRLAQHFGQTFNHVLGVRASIGYDTIVNQTHRVLSHRGPTTFTSTGDPIYENAAFAEDDPARAHRALFGDGTTSPGEDLGARRAARLHAMDFLDRELRAAGRVGGERGVRIERHRGAVAEARTAIEASEVPTSCMPPVLPPYGDISDSDNNPMLMDAQMSNIVSALACDAARVMFLQYGIAGGGHRHKDGGWFLGRYGFSLAQAQRDCAEGVTESALRYSFIDDHAISHATAESAFPYMFRLNHWYAGQVAELATRLESVRTSTGTLLDDTIIVWFSENGQVPHQSRELPFVLVGGSNWVNHGTEIEAGQTTQVPLLRTLGRIVTQDPSFTIGDDSYAGDMEKLAPLIRSRS